MGNGLKQQWGVADPAEAGSDKQSQQFKASFEKEITVITGHLTYTATNAEATRHAALALRRDALYPSFQSALGQIDQTNPGKAQGAIDKVLNDEKALNGEVTKFRKEAEKARTDWQARQPKFDGAIRQVEELEAWGDAKAAPLRGLVDGIRKQVNERKFAQACTTSDQLLPKLKPIHDEYLKQKEAHKKYQSALEALQPKLSDASVSRYAKLKLMQDDMAAIHTQMETAAQSKNFVQALKGVTDLAVKVDVYTKALAELEKQKKAYEGALVTLEPRLTTGPQPHAKLEPMHQEIGLVRGKMETAAQKEDYAEALKFAKDLSPKLDIYDKAVAEVEKRKKAYEDALAPLKEKLSKACEPRDGKLTPLQNEIVTLQKEMETAATNGEYEQALKSSGKLPAKLDAYAKESGSAGDGDDAKVCAMPNTKVQEGSEKEQLLAMATALDKAEHLKASFADGAHYKVKFQGKSGEVNQAVLDAACAQLTKGITAAADKVERMAADADGQYSTLKKAQTRDTSGKVITWIINKIMIDDPGPKVVPLVAQARAGVGTAKGGSRGKFVAAANALIAADGAASQAKRMTQYYFDGVISSGETLVTILEGVKFACEITLAVGGGPAGFLGGLAITTAENLAPAAYGDKVNWGKLAIDIVVDTVLYKFKCKDAINAAILKQLEAKVAKSVSRKVMEEVLANVIATQLTSAVTAVVKAPFSQKAPLTWQQLVDKVNQDVTKMLLEETLKALAKK